MATLEIPTFQDGDGHVFYTVQLEGTLYYFYLDWNNSDDSWYLSIHDSTDTPIRGCLSRRLCTNWSILRGATSEYKPPGQIITSSTDHADPELLDLGTRVGLYYLETTNG